MEGKKQLSRFKLRLIRKKQITIDGHTQMLANARARITKHMLTFGGDLRELSKDEKEFILDDAAQSTQSIRDALERKSTQLSNKELQQLSQYRRKQVTIDGRTRLVSSARASIINRVHNLSGKISELSKDEKKFILDDDTAQSTQPIRDALERKSTRLSNKELQQLSQYRPKWVTIDSHTREVGNVRASIINRVLTFGGDLRELSKDEKEFILGEIAQSMQPIRDMLERKSTRLTNTGLQQLSQYKKQVTIDGHTRLVSLTRVNIINHVYASNGNLSELSKDTRKFILDDTAQSTQPIRDALEQKSTRLSNKGLQQLSQRRRKRVTIDGQTRKVGNVRASIINHVCASNGNLSELSKDMRKFILDDTAQSTQPIRDVLERKSTRLSNKGLQKLSPYRKKQATIDGQTRRVMDARKVIIERVCASNGNLSELSKDTRKFILDDTTQSTQPIRDALEQKSTQLSNKELQQLSQYRRKRVTIDGQTRRVTDVRASIINRVYNSNGKISELSKDVRKFILDDTAQSTQSIRNVLERRSTQLSNKELQQLSQYRRKRVL